MIENSSHLTFSELIQLVSTIITFIGIIIAFFVGLFAYKANTKQTAKQVQMDNKNFNLNILKDLVKNLSGLLYYVNGVVGSLNKASKDFGNFQKNAENEHQNIKEHYQGVNKKNEGIAAFLSIYRFSITIDEDLRSSFEKPLIMYMKTSKDILDKVDELDNDSSDVSKNHQILVDINRNNEKLKSLYKQILNELELIAKSLTIDL